MTKNETVATGKWCPEHEQFEQDIQVFRTADSRIELCVQCGCPINDHIDAKVVSS